MWGQPVMELNFKLNERGIPSIQAELLGFLAAGIIFLSILRFIIARSLSLNIEYFYVPLVAFILMIIVCFKDFKRMFV